MNYKKMLDVYAESSNKFCKMNVNVIKTLMGGIKYTYTCENIYFLFSGSECFEKSFGRGKDNTYLNSIMFYIHCPDNEHKISINIHFSPSTVWIYWGCSREPEYLTESIDMGDIQMPFSLFFKKADEIFETINSEIEEISTLSSEYMIRTFCNKMREKDGWRILI